MTVPFTLTYALPSRLASFRAPGSGYTPLTTPITATPQLSFFARPSTSSNIGSGLDFQFQNLTLTFDLQRALDAYTLGGHATLQTSQLSNGAGDMIAVTMSAQKQSQQTRVSLFGGLESLPWTPKSAPWLTVLKAQVDTLCIVLYSMLLHLLLHVVVSFL